MKTTARASVVRGHIYDEDCPRCVFRKISSSLLLEGTFIKKMASGICGRFSEQFKFALAAEIRKYQPVGFKAIEITSLTVDKEHNLFIEFDILVIPQYNTLIRNALKRAAISLDVSPIFLIRI